MCKIYQKKIATQIIEMNQMAETNQSQSMAFITPHCSRATVSATVTPGYTSPSTTNSVTRFHAAPRHRAPPLWYQSLKVAHFKRNFSLATKITTAIKLTNISSRLHCRYQKSVHCIQSFIANIALEGIHRKPNALSTTSPFLHRDSSPLPSAPSKPASTEVIYIGEVTDIGVTEGAFNAAQASQSVGYHISFYREEHSDIQSSSCSRRKNHRRESSKSSHPF